MELNQYMVEINLPFAPSEKFMSLIPRQRAVINGMVNKGNISSYTLSLDRGKMWSVFIAKSKSEVEMLLEKWPMIEYMECEIHELFFHEMASNALPTVSLN